MAATAVAFAAADTYVVVLALPDMMGSAGIPIEELQRAAPIISGFLLGYVAMLPLIGRIADLRGRLPVLSAALVIFAIGSLVTALAYDLPSIVTGRFLQGLGGGGLVPATLALVADLYPADRRGVPLGIVSAVQEIGSVLGPLLGALVLAFATWRGIFALNLVAGIVLVLVLARLARRGRDPSDVRRPWLPDPVGLVLLLVLVVSAVVVFLQPAALVTDITWGELFLPLVGSGRWLTPVGLVAIGAGLLLTLRCATAARPLVDVRSWTSALREADLVGAVFLATALGGVIMAFATADPQVQVFSTQGWWYLLGAAAGVVAFVLHLRRSPAPLIPRGALRPRPAWGAVVVSFFVGAALVAALIDIPLFARTTTYPDSQLLAALVLVRFLVALPLGAVLGGYLTRTVDAGLIAGGGMILAAGGFLVMSQWDADSLTAILAPTLTLLMCGFGFGLALAPVNAAMLATTDDAVHGLASAMVVVARMVGMLVGISALTTIGLRRFYAAQADLPGVAVTCGEARLCDAYRELQTAAGITLEQTVFLGAMVCAVAAAGSAVVLFRGAPTRSPARSSSR